MTFPILEHDPNPEAFIEPARVVRARDVPEHCVICFFRDVVEAVAAQHAAKTVVNNAWEDGPHPLYEIEYRGRRLAFLQPGVGAAMSAGILEEVIAAGCRKFIACGGAGVLDQDLAVGHLVVVSGAIRDEGVSYHYLPPAREVSAGPQGMRALMDVLEDGNIPYRLGKTWTTDAPYRETPAKIASRRQEGCLTVEMEAAGLLAVAHFRGVVLGQILYGGDDLSGVTWDNRDWQSKREIRENLFWLSARACLAL